MGGLQAIFHLVMIITLLLAGGLWLAFSTPVYGQCRAALTTFGTAYAMLAAQLIFAHMAKMPYEPSLWLVGIVIAGTLNSALLFFPPFKFTIVALLTVVCAYLEYMSSIMTQICKHLNISCFTIDTKEVS